MTDVRQTKGHVLDFVVTPPPYCGSMTDESTVQTKSHGLSFRKGMTLVVDLKDREPIRETAGIVSDRSGPTLRRFVTARSVHRAMASTDDAKAYLPYAELVA